MLISLMGLSLFTPAVQVHYLTCCEQQQLFPCQGISHPAESYHTSMALRGR